MRINESTLYEIYSIIEEIPYGNVATYGQIAKLSGYPNHARLVGKALSLANLYGDFPCHRVVNHQGRLVPGWKEQKYLLEKEKIIIKENGCVDLKKHQWITKN